MAMWWGRVFVHSYHPAGIVGWAHLAPSSPKCEMALHPPFSSGGRADNDVPGRGIDLNKERNGRLHPLAGVHSTGFVSGQWWMF